MRMRPKPITTCLLMLVLGAAHCCTGCSRKKEQVAAPRIVVPAQPQAAAIPEIKAPAQPAGPVYPIPDDGTPGPNLLGISQINSDSRYLLIVKESGIAYTRRYTTRSLSGGPTSDSPLSKEVLEQLRILLGKLPPSTPNPPDNRTLVIHRFDGGTAQAFCYDRANPPDVVLEVLRVSRSYISTWSPRIPPDGEWKAHRDDEGSMVALTKSNQFVTCARYQPLRVWDCETHELVREIALPTPRSDSATAMAVSMDERYIALTGSRCMIADTTTWRVTDRKAGVFKEAPYFEYYTPGFGPDGSHLFLRTGAPGTGFFEVGTWTPAPVPPGFPEGMIKFAPMGSSGGVMTLTKEGKLAMSDATGLMTIIRDKGVRDFCCAVTPSLELTAVAIGIVNSSQKLGYRIFIVDTHSGNIIRELRPDELDYDGTNVVSLFWSPDSAYVMAALRGGDIAVWNAKTGRHRGTLGSQGNTTNGAVLSPDKTTLYEFRGNGVIQYWKLEPALATIRAFEATLGFE